MFYSYIEWYLFYRVSNAKSVERNDTRLGLSIAKPGDRKTQRKNLDRIRAMDDIDFKLHSKELAEEIKQTFKPSSPEEPNVLGRIKRFLSVDNIIPILEERIHKSS